MESKKERKVFLEDLPKWESGGNKGKIDWHRSIGMIVPFIYDNIKGEFKIIDLMIEKTNKKIMVEYNNEKHIIGIQMFMQCKIAKLINCGGFKYRYNIGDIVNTITGSIEILKQIKILKSNNYSRKGYLYKCLKDGYVGEIFEYSLEIGTGCPVCSNSKIVKGINDMATTHPYLLKYFVNIEDAFTHSYGYDGKVLLKCPDCGFERKQTMNILTTQYKNGFTCPNCGDGFSYPEKVMNNVLKQLNIKFNTQKTFNWSKNIKYKNKKLNGNKTYDFYIPAINCIIETHGEQHYEKAFHTQFEGRTLQDEQENDKLKEELALKHGVKKENYIIIDCRHTDFQWIKEHIINSNLFKLFDLSNIDWIECGKYASNSLIKTVSNLWKQGVQSTTKIGEKIGVDRHTAQKYLKQASLLGFCNYKTKYEIKKENMTKVCELWNDNIRNTLEIAQKLKIDTSTVCKYLNKLSQLGLCDYDGKEESLKMCMLNSKLNRKPVMCIETHQIFHSAKEIEEKSLELFNVNLQASSIRNVCTGKFKQYKGFTFKYIDEDNELNK